MAIPRELVAQVRRLDEYDLRRLMILVRGLLLHADGPPDPSADDEMQLGKVSYRQEHVRCGKERCGTCPHGPYWYAYWREEGKTRSRYIGRHLPGETPAPVIPDLSRESKPRRSSREGKPPPVQT
ncbi:MAG: hypothetical protein M3O70_17715 [Actinomycetota bacterium]|nr:hypothetical protein [Actinomycetota bacterium]